MSQLTSRWFWAAALLLALASPSNAQYGVATLTHADGGVTRQHRGAPAATTIGVSIIDGDQIETSNGRAEVMFLDGTLVHLDRNSAVIVLAGERMKMLSGRVSLRTSGSRTYVAEAAGSRIHVNTTTVIDMSAQSGKQDATIRVVSGKARVESSAGPSLVPDYHRIYLAGPASAPAVTKVVPEPADEFERWALTRLVLASSVPLKGTEHGGGVAYSPYGYFGFAGYGYYGYAVPYSYSYTYTRYHYPVTRYYAPYTAPTYYYSTPYYAAPYYNYGGYYGAPNRTFYDANINTVSSYLALTNQFVTTPTASTSSPAPSSAPAPAARVTAPTASKGVPVPKP